MYQYLDVQDAGHELEAGAPNEQQQTQPFQRLRDRTHRRPVEKLRDDRPQLAQQHRNQRDSQGHMRALREAVQPRRTGRPREEIEAEQPRVGGHVVATQVRVVRRVRQQARDEHDADAHQQRQSQDRGQPRPPDGAAPKRSAERSPRGMIFDQRAKLRAPGIDAVRHEWLAATSVAHWMAHHPVDMVMSPSA